MAYSSVPSAIAKAVNDVFFKIPKEVLTLAFTPDYYVGYADNRSLEQRIIDTIIHGKVLPDCNLSTGQLVSIPLEGLPLSQTTSGWIIEIPPHLTNGRRITNVLNVEYGYQDMMAYGGAMQTSGGDLFSNAVSMMYQSTIGGYTTGNAHVHLVGPNTILIRDISRIGNLFLRCMIEHDPGLNNIQTSGYQAFANIVVLACKMYVYTHISIRVGEGAINGGSMNGYFRSIIDEYSSAAEEYEEAFMRWRKVAAFSDRKTYDDIINMQLRY